MDSGVAAKANCGCKLINNNYDPDEQFKHALVVEDDANTASALARVLTALDFSVDLATSLKQAKELIAKRVPDIVLLDLSLPDGNGLEIMLELQPGLQTRFVVITGNQSQHAVIESLRANVDDFLVKPISLSNLRNSLARSMEKQEAARDKQVRDLSEIDEKAILDCLVGKTFWRMEKDLLMATLERHNGDKVATAKTLGISLKTLYNRLHAYT